MVVAAGAAGISEVAGEASMVVDSAVAGSTAEGSAADTLEGSVVANSAGSIRGQLFTAAVLEQLQVSLEAAREWAVHITPDRVAHRSSSMVQLPDLLSGSIAQEPRGTVR